MEAAESRPCKALRPQKAEYYEGMRKLQRMDGSQDGGETVCGIRTSSTAQAVRPRRALALPYRVTK